MSGGSYGYLCFKEPEELIGRAADIEMMAQRILDAGYPDVAGDMQRLAEYCKSARLRVAVLSDMLNSVMHAVEWYDSGDYGLDNFKKVLDEYRDKNGLEKEG